MENSIGINNLMYVREKKNPTTHILINCYQTTKYKT